MYLLYGWHSCIDALAVSDFLLDDVSVAKRFPALERLPLPHKVLQNMLS